MAYPKLDKPRGPIAQKALRQAISRRARSLPRFSEIEGPKEQRQFERRVNTRYGELKNRILPKNTPLKDIYKKRLSFLRLPAGQQNQIRTDRKERRDLNKYLGGDSDFQAQKSMFDKAFADYAQSNTAQRERVGQDFGLATSRLAQEREKGRGQITEDFGSRGVLKSGIFLKDLSEYDTEYGRRVADLTRDKDRSFEDLAEDKRLFRSETQARLQAARQEAIRRRAVKQGIGLSNPVAKKATAKKAVAKKAAASKKKRRR